MADGGGGSPGGKDVIDDEHILPRLNGVGVHFETIHPIFQCVIDATLLPGQLSGFSDGDKSGIQSQRNGRREKISARLNSGNKIDGLPGVLGFQRLDGFGRSVLAEHGLAAAFGANIGAQPRIDLRGIERTPSLNQKDGIHPNAAGARIIANGLAPVVAQALKSKA